jgi:hypothetical protein
MPMWKDVPNLFYDVENVDFDVRRGKTTMSHTWSSIPLYCLAV